ncbi:hypothetical protein AHAS_Ahas04G0146900 [Arachis hypogaea]
MSDIPPKRVILPDLPNEIMLGIFYRCDARMLLSVRSTCHYWRNKLNYYEFITEMGTRWKSNGCSFLAGFGFSSRSVNYSVVHIFKEKPESPSWTLTMSTNLVRDWNVSLTCLPYVDRLDLDYVSLDGVIYWSYSSTIWQAAAINDDIIWSKLYMFNGIGVPYIPALFVNDNLLHIMERHLPMLDMDGIKSTYFHILKVQ